MKNLFFGIAAFIAIIFSLQSCSEEINLIGEFEETAVVYGLLDQTDSVHYIKINRAFIGPGNSLEIAAIPDSSYFNQVTATITEIGGDGREWTLVEETITNKDENGIFYAPDQVVYAFYSKSIDNSTNNTTGNPLDPSATYRLDISVNNGEFQISGETGLVSGIYTNTDNTTYSFKFAKNASEFKSTSIGVTVGNSYVVNTAIDFEYSEFEGAVETQKAFTWTLGEADVLPGDVQTFVANGQTFYEEVAKQMAIDDLANPNVDKRNFKGFTVRVIAGSEDLYNYMLVNEPSSSLSQNKPTYTNMEATDGHQVIGVFASRFTFEKAHEFSTPSSQFIRCLDKASTEVLCTGPLTGPYLFCSQHALDAAPTMESWACN